jgi:tetratricopeptide (TPR) repeat protein
MAEAADLAGRLVRHNPLDENFQALLVRSLAAAGDGVGAARQAAACRELFQRELGMQPGATLDAALRTAHRPPTARPATGPPPRWRNSKPGEAAISAGALDAGVQCLRRAIVEADATGDPVLRARPRWPWAARWCMPRAAATRKAPPRCTRRWRWARMLSPPLAAAACRELGYVEFLRGRYERTLAWLQRARPLAGEDRAELARIAIVHGSALSDTAHYPPAIALLFEAVSLLRRQWETQAAGLCAVHVGPRADAAWRTRRRGRARWTARWPWRSPAGPPSCPGRNRCARKSTCCAATSAPRGPLRACVRARLPARRPLLGRHRGPRPGLRGHRARRDGSAPSKS